MHQSKRIQREKQTIKTMIRHYCRINHLTTEQLCLDCQDLLDYALKRLDNCPFQEGKTTCGKCPIHCYQPAKREKIREVMRTIGPKMLLTNPVMGIRHALDGLKKIPEKKRR